MNILTAEQIKIQYGIRKILDNVSFYLHENEKVGVIGINGTGKSTFLKILAGLEVPDDGKIVLANNHVVRFLPQTPVFDDKETVLEAVLRDNIGKNNDSTIEAEAKNMLTRLGVYDFEQPCGQLSGGQRKRLALVSVLLSDAEILVLDEPTNHLDSEMSDWLENSLKNRRGALIMVTHDRYFLDSVCNRIVEIDKGNLYSYDANYAGFLELKMQREEMERATAKKRANILRTELEWVRRGAQARSTKQKARLDRFKEMSAMEGPKEDERVVLSSVSSRLGRTTVELHNICKNYEDKTLIKDFTYLFLKNDRVGFVGPNGCGKSTLMKIILDDCQADSGRIEIGQTVKIGYYAQEINDEMMKPSDRVIDYIRDVAEYVETPDGKISASAMLERFLFAGEDQYGLISKLSGGEKRRLYLCKVLMGAPNVLILDEPTNDLDIATLQILEDYLDNFTGIVITVSHDRYFLDRVVRRIIAFEGNGVLKQYEGGYSDYKLRVEFEGLDVSELNKGAGSKDGNGKSSGNITESGEGAANKSNDWKADRKKKLKFTYNEEREYATIEEDIAKLEEEIEGLESDLLKYTRDFVKLNEITKQKEDAEKALEEKMDRWMYLEDLAARIENGEMV